ncbi:hypothetical protein Ocin01_02147 [Orchesella cincta]|uniref:Uncharacterized protein n=1 Tax=Orchesella cincta TaxID=48709 RepID=A0A1D2NH15_ORCCI|nr:hypothetical protein Ocin01_02147 [Orchesella cincta]
MNGRGHSISQGENMHLIKQPGTVAEKREYIVRAKNFLKEKAMSSKVNFADFMIYYKSHQNEMDMEWKFEEIGALSVLTEKWKQADGDSNIQHYYKMERFHDFLNARLLEIEDEGSQYKQEVLLWRRYIGRFNEWIETALLHQYKIQQFGLSE